MTCACGCDVKLALFIVLLITSFICLKQDEVFWALEDLSQQDEFEVSALDKLVPPDRQKDRH